MLTSRGLGTVLGDLSEMGYDAEWGILGAHHAGAPHKRDRIWILAYTPEVRRREGDQERRGTCEGKSETGERGGSTNGSEISDSERDGLEGGESAGRAAIDMRRRFTISDCPSWWDIDPADMADTSIGRCGESEEREIQQSRRTEAVSTGESLPDTLHPGGECNRNDAGMGRQRKPITRNGGSKRPIESSVGRVAHGVANRVDRLKAIGNGQVPAVAALAFVTLLERVRNGE